MTRSGPPGFPPPDAEIYNATVIAVRDISPRLRILRVRPDEGPAAWTPGQYIGLGLPVSAPRVDPERSERVPPGGERDLIVRHYSLSHPILTGDGSAIVQPGALDHYEFYAALPLYRPDEAEPKLPSRLFALRKEERIFVEPEPAGRYTAEMVAPGEDVIFMATGTGEAPHNALVWHLLSRGHQGRIVSVICTQRREQQAYLETHRRIERLRPGYRYLALTTREPEDEGRRVHLQSYVDTGALERDLGWAPDPARSHVFLCGNPAMIGVPRRRPGSRSYPEPRGMIQVLEERGFNADERSGRRVNVHYERFW